MLISNGSLNLCNEAEVRDEKVNSWNKMSPVCIYSDPTDSCVLYNEVGDEYIHTGRTYTIN